GWDPLSEGLVAHYPFDGNPDDISGNNNHGTNVGATPTKDRFGNENSAYLFDGIDNRVASNLDWSVGDNDEFTITVWARTNPDISNLRYRIFSKFENGSGDAFGLALRPPDESTACFIRNDNSIWSAASIDFSTVNARDGNWHLFTMKRSEGMLSLKIDNHPWKDTIDLTWYDGYIMEWYNIQIGCFRDENNPEGYYDSFWDGEIDDIRFYQKALTDEEISSLYHENGWDPLSEGLVAHYPFNGNPDDISGNNNHGTNFGASLINDRFGNESTAYSLDGIDDKIVIPDLDLLQPASLSCWFKTDTLKNSYIFTSDFYDDFGGVHNGLALEIWEGKLYASFGEGGSARYTGINDSLITPAQWHNISVTWEDNTGVINIYIDGQIAPVSEFGNTVLTTAVNTGYEDTFGADSNSDGGPSYLFGELDDIRIYNRILNEGEIDSLYHENGWD
ncbi:MAG: hypothetical protein KAS71_02610, partial [Bacteroidales bacterium]|nr:hypothetical protein [Bacteroidales bacterium]